jgi:hypothetical protein
MSDSVSKHGLQLVKIRADRRKLCQACLGSISKSNAPLAQAPSKIQGLASANAEQHATVQVEAAYQALVVSVIKVFETASRANGGRLWLVWLMTLRGSPFVLHVNALARADIAKANGPSRPALRRGRTSARPLAEWSRLRRSSCVPLARTMAREIWMLGKRYSAQGPRRVLIS